MTMICRRLSTLLILFCLGCSAANSTSDSPSAEKVAAAAAAAETPGFRPLRLGGGGYVVDLDFSPDGQTRIARTDVHGAYIWDEPAKEWKQLFNAASVPTGDPMIGTGSGIAVYAVRVAPSDSARIYAVLPGFPGFPSTVHRSDDRGASWNRTKFTPVEMSVQSGGRLMGPKMAIDPRNPDIVLVGDTAGRIYRTADGGKNWVPIEQSQIPAGAEPAIAFAGQGGSGGRTSVGVYVATGSNGVHRSTDGGLRWSRTEGGPRSIDRLVASTDGLYATDRDELSPKNAWKLTGDRWTRLEIPSPGNGNGWHSIAVDPNNTRRVVLGSAAGYIATSLDGGTTWGEFHRGPAERIATDVPWLAWAQEDWMSNGNMMFDPVVPDRLYFAQGIGVWHTVTSTAGVRVKWSSQTRGIEELVVNDLVVPPGGKPIFAVQDRGVFRVESPELYPTSHGPSRDVSIRHTWSLDYAADDPSFIAQIANGGSSDRSSYSRDGGRTWVPFESNGPANPPGNLGGTIAVSSSKNIVWAPSNNGRPFFTTDGGRTWQLARFPAELPISGESGWTFSLYQNRHIFAADRVLPNTFYAYNYGPSTALSASGTYRSTDGGATWAKVSGGFDSAGRMGTSARLATVPGKAGHLFFAVGTTPWLLDPKPYDVPLKRSRDGGRTWQDVKKTQEIWAIGFGKAAPGAAYPAIYIAGFANGDNQPAIYRSIDDGATWQKLTSHPSGNVDSIRAISGDMNIYGRIYYGFSGSGAGYGVVPN